MSRSSPVGGFFRLVILLVVIAALICIFAPLLLNGVIVKEINTYFDDTLKIEKADLSIWPLRLQLHDVHIKNSPKYTKGDLLTIGEIKIDATWTNSKTVIVKSITYSEVAGFPEIVDDMDNFTAYKVYLKSKWDKVPTGVWRWPVTVESVQLRNAWIGNQDPLVKMEDRNFDPIGSMQDPVSVQEAFIQSLDNVLTEQRSTLPKVMLQNIKKRIGNAMDSISKKIQDMTE